MEYPELPFANQEHLRAVCLNAKPKSFLEIGVWRGWSLEVVLDYANLDYLVLCDFWSREWGPEALPGPEHIEELLLRRKFQGFTQYLNGDSVKQLQNFKPRTLFDLIHVDGCHKEPWVSADLENSWRVLAPGGHLVVDDLLHAPVVHAAVKSLCARLGTQHVLVDLELKKKDGCATIRKV